MVRQLSPKSSLAVLKQDAKRSLASLRNADAVIPPSAVAVLAVGSG